MKIISFIFSYFNYYYEIKNIFVFQVYIYIQTRFPDNSNVLGCGLIDKVSDNSNVLSCGLTRKLITPMYLVVVWQGFLITPMYLVWFYVDDDPPAKYEEKKRKEDFG